jgi:hypothetical protein
MSMACRILRTSPTSTILLIDLADANLGIDNLGVANFLTPYSTAPLCPSRLNPGAQSTTALL